MKPTYKASLLLIGDELTTGAINDTNGRWLAEKLNELGFTIVGIEIVRDRIEEISEALKRGGERGDLVVATGGLGPTTDDLTRDAFASFLGVELVEHQISLDKILARYAQRGIPMNPISRRQALFPSGATIVNNSAGTADSFWCELPNTKALAFSFPGVPHEMKRIFEEELIPVLKKRFPGTETPQAAYLRCFGLSESAIGTAIEKVNLGEKFIVGYRPVYPEVWVKFSGPSLTKNECDSAVEKSSNEIGLQHIISNSYDISLAKVVLDLLEENNLTVSFAESCSGGLASSLLVGEPGSSKSFLGSIICYSNEMKINHVGVSKEIIEKHGAVSSETAVELARGVRKRTGSSIGVSITGIAGPDGGTEQKPVGTVFFGYSSDKKDEVVRHYIQFERNRFRAYTAHVALDLIRRDLKGFPLQFARR